MSGVSAPAQPDALPIPRDVQPGPGWTDRMLELAEHIGAWRTLLLVDHHGGQEVYISVDPAKNSLRTLLGARASGILSQIYPRERFVVPVGKHALARARRAPILARVRAETLTVAAAARMLKTSRTYVSHLVNETSEGCEPGTLAAPPRRFVPRQIELFGD